MKVDLERLRRVCVSADGTAVGVRGADLAALLAVVDAARQFVSSTFAEPAAAAEWARQHGRGETGRFAVLVTSLEPFTPPAARAWEEVDRWNAEQATGPCIGARDERCDPRPGMCACFDREERDLAVKAAVDATRVRTLGDPAIRFGPALLREQDCEPPSPEARREWTRDYVALVGEVVQRQFRSDQERIVAFEAKIRQLLGELEQAERERDEWRGRHKAVTNGLSNHVARADEAEERLARVPALVDALQDKLLDILDVTTGWSSPTTDEQRIASIEVLAKAARVALAEWEKP